MDSISILDTTTTNGQAQIESSLNGSNGNGDSEIVVTDLLIIGTGPAGASLACFLASHGLNGIMLGHTRGCADTPRAHITNPAALECLRDIGLENECVNSATKGDCMLHTRWAHSMTGEEYARIHSWGNAPARMGDYDAASPCKHVDLPQTILEPILVRHAGLNGFTCRFDTTFLSFEREASGYVISRVQDNISKHIYQIKSKYLFGADGARSQIMKQLQIPLIKKPGQGLAINVIVNVDLSHVVKHRMGNLHWIMQPKEDYAPWGWAAVARMVKPWHEWMFVFLPAPGAGVDFEVTDTEYLKRVKEMIGDDSIPVEITGVSKWFINEIVAEYYSKGNIFCLGDAVHRHPPFNGLGSNTCIQDAFNLAWKIAYVEKGLAGPSLLSTFNTERQPVGLSVVTRANQGLRDHLPVWQALGMLEPTLSARTHAFAELSAPTAKGAARRALLQQGIEATAREFQAIGVEMNHHYASTAVYVSDEESPTFQLPADADPVLHYHITTYPGSRLPHAWLNMRSPGKRFSTIDLAGHGAFCLLTGIGGQAWKDAAGEVGRRLGVEIRAYSIGWMGDYEDVYFDWARRREVEEDGCVLVRPDRFVAWRARSMVEGCDEKLTVVLKSVLSR